MLVWPLRVVSLCVVLGAWQMAAASGVLNSAFTSDPTSIGSAFVRQIASGELWGPTGTTLFETTVGFLVGSAAGFVVGAMASQVRLLETVLRPYMTALNSLPRIALAPLFVLWFGFGSLSRVMLSISLVFFIVAINTTAGLDSISRDFLVLARTLGARPSAEFAKFILPNAIPTIFAGLQLALVYSFTAVVAGEMIGGSGGLGANLQLTLATFRTQDFFATLLMLMILAVIASILMRKVERRILRWRAVELQGLQV